MQRLNGCHNRQRPTAGAITHWAQDGYMPAVDNGDGSFSRERRWVPVRHVMSTECKTDISATSPACKGCVNAPHLIKQGEQDETRAHQAV